VTVLLEARHIETGYGKKPVVRDVSVSINHGEILAMIGPNGAGKSTVLKAICGLLPVWRGDVLFEQKSISGSTPAKNVSRGMTFCPQGNRVFHGLTVKENLEIGGYSLSQREVKERIAQVVELFPALKDRPRQDAGSLSGGEQQMLALARALVAKPKLLMLDEPSLGLAPNLLADMFTRIVEINRQTGVAILIVEQKVDMVLSICSRAYALKLGRVSFCGSADDLRTAKAGIRDLFL
jgi:branched-chain amino acid transport system ATP-binding protein